MYSISVYFSIASTNNGCQSSASIPVSYTHLDVYKRQGQDHARNGNDDGFRKILDHTEHAAIPALRGLSDLPGHIRDLAVYRFKNTGVLPGDRFDQALFDPVCYPIKQTAHRLLTEQAGQERNQRGTHQGDTAARHKLLDPLGFCLCPLVGRRAPREEIVQLRYKT